MKNDSEFPSSLSNTLEYKNQDVIDKFCSLYSVSEIEANILFEELKKWLWLCAKNRALRKNSTNSIPKMRVLNSQLMLDEMWHTFIVFTIDYHEFCNNFLGGYIHHAPITRSGKEVTTHP